MASMGSQVHPSDSGLSRSTSARSDILERVAPGCSEAPDAIFKRCLVNEGLRYTAERREILRAVLSTHEHFDADSLFIAMYKRGAKASKATIYRSLALLCKIGILREAFHGPKGASYEHVYGHEHHEHMICMHCGKVIGFTSKQLESLQDEACRTKHFHPVHHHLQIFGYCRGCFKPAHRSGTLQTIDLSRSPAAAKSDAASSGTRKVDAARSSGTRRHI